MPAYIIVYRESPVRDQAAIDEYSRLNRENAGAFQQQFGIRPLVVYGASQALEGENPDGIVMLQFPSVEEAKAWYESPAYQEALAFGRTQPSGASSSSRVYQDSAPRVSVSARHMCPNRAVRFSPGISRASPSPSGEWRKVQTEAAAPVRKGTWMLGPTGKCWSGREDSNLRPLPPEDSALPG
jgi:uncharacterized protein (DUF1330 family)